MIGWKKLNTSHIYFEKDIKYILHLKNALCRHNHSQNVHYSSNINGKYSYMYHTFKSADSVPDCSNPFKLYTSHINLRYV